MSRRYNRTLLVILFLLTWLGTERSGYGDTPYIGEIRWVAFNFAPTGWALCDGQLLPIAQNDALFTLISTTYGGDGQTTFALPDLRGRSALHAGQGGGLSLRVIGEHGGQETHTISVSEMPTHSHQPLALTAIGSTPSPTGGYWAGSSGKNNLYSTIAPDAIMASRQVQSIGGSQPHNLMPPFQALTCIISLQGIFPSQN